MPLDTAWRLWEDREQIPQFMPWIASVKVGGLGGLGGLGVSHVRRVRTGLDWIGRSALPDQEVVFGRWETG